MMMNRPEDEFEQILEYCLNLLQNRQETVESLLARYPAYAEELRPALEAAVWLRDRRDRLEPQPGFVATSRRRLVNRIQREAPVSFLDRLRQIAGSYSQRRSLAFRFASLLVIFALLFTGGTRISLAAQESLPGDTLYPLKLGLEKAAEVLASNEQDADLHIQFVERRLIEIQELTLEGRYEHISATVNNLETQVNAVIDDIDKASSQDGEQAREIASSLSMTLRRQTPMIDMLSDAVPQEAKPLFDRARQVSQTGIVAAETVLGEEDEEEPEEEQIVLPTATALPTGTASATATHTPSVTPSGTPRPTGEETVEATPVGTRLPPFFTSTPTPTPKPEEPDEEPTREPTRTPTVTPTQPTPTSPPEMPTQPPTPGRPTPTLAPTETPPASSTSLSVTDTPEPPEPVDPPKPSKTAKVKPTKDAVSPGLEDNPGEPLGEPKPTAPARGVRVRN